MWRRAGLTGSRFVACPFGGAGAPGNGCIAPGIWCVGVLMGSCSIWGVPMSRSRSAGIASSCGEVQAALAGLDGVEQAVVIAREDRPGDKRLVGYVTGTADPAEVRAALAERLPAYMVPAAVVVIDALPLTVNGKLDTRALPAPEYQDGDRYRAPANPIEEILAGIYAQVLGVERVGVDDSFFDLGGDSLSAMRVIAAINTALDAHLAVRTLFDAPSVRSLSQQLGRHASSDMLCVRARPRHHRGARRRPHAGQVHRRHDADRRPDAARPERRGAHGAVDRGDRFPRALPGAGMAASGWSWSTAR